MALKDWKKIKTTQMSNVWQRKSGRHWIEAIFHWGRKTWFVEVVKENRAVIQEEFKNKSQALKFAKSYMRKH